MTTSFTRKLEAGERFYARELEAGGPYFTRGIPRGDSFERRRGDPGAPFFHRTPAKPQKNRRYAAGRRYWAVSWSVFSPSKHASRAPPNTLLERHEEFPNTF